MWRYRKRFENFAWSFGSKKIFVWKSENNWTRCHVWSRDASTSIRLISLRKKNEMNFPFSNRDQFVEILNEEENLSTRWWNQLWRKHSANRFSTVSIVRFWREISTTNEFYFPRSMPNFSCREKIFCFSSKKNVETFSFFFSLRSESSSFLSRSRSSWVSARSLFVFVNFDVRTFDERRSEFRRDKVRRRKFLSTFDSTFFLRFQTLKIFLVRRSSSIRNLIRSASTNRRRPTNFFTNQNQFRPHRRPTTIFFDRIDFQSFSFSFFSRINKFLEFSSKKNRGKSRSFHDWVQS